MRGCHLQEALQNLSHAISEVESILEEIRTEQDPLALHIFVARRDYRKTPDTKSGKRKETVARLSWRRACDLGFRGALGEWERLMGAAPKRWVGPLWCWPLVAFEERALFTIYPCLWNRPINNASPLQRATSRSACARTLIQSWRKLTHSADACPKSSRSAWASISEPKGGRWAQVVAKQLAVDDASNLQWPIALAYATRRLESLEAARAILLDAVSRHPKEPIIHYNLGCYSCQLGDLESAKDHLKRAFALEPQCRAMALDE